MNSNARYISATDTAKLVRADLKAHFPYTVFSVRCHHGSIDVRWTDGATSLEVQPILNHYEGATFDGMIDLRGSQDTEHEGELVHFGASFVQGQRECTPAFKNKCAYAVATYFHLPVPLPLAEDDLYGWFERKDDVTDVLGRDGLIELIVQLMNCTNAETGDCFSRWGDPDTWMMRAWQGARELDAYRDNPLTRDFVMDYENGAIDEAQLDRISAPTIVVTPEAVTISDPLRERLDALNIDALSPLEALTALYELKRMS